MLDQDYEYVAPILWRMCLRKTAHPTRQQARAAARHVRFERGAAVSVFRCFFGPHYHIGKRAGWHRE